MGERHAETLQSTLAGRQPLVIYYAGPEAGGLIGERYWVEPGDRTPERALELLLLGPVSPHLVHPLPAGVQVLGVSVQDGTAWVNFSEDLVTRHGGGTAGETMSVYAVVNTLTELTGVERVALLVEGRAVETLAGHLDLARPLERDPSLIERVVLPSWGSGHDLPFDARAQRRWPWWPPAPL